MFTSHFKTVYGDTRSMEIGNMLTRDFDAVEFSLGRHILNLTCLMYETTLICFLHSTVDQVLHYTRLSKPDVMPLSN